MIVAAFAIVVPPSIVMAAPTYGGGTPQAYDSDSPLATGTIVQLDGKNAAKVKASTSADMQNMFGVVVDPSQVIISSTSDSLQNPTFVSVSGTYNTLVSTEGGPIKIGDYVTLSSVDGVAMKASTKQPTVFGRAAAAFDGKGVTVGQTTLKDTSGKTTGTVTLGLIPVTINIQHNPDVKSTKVNLPQYLQRLGEQIAEHSVSPVRIYLSMAITGASIITALVLLYAGVRNAIISIGRNPMSKKSIVKALIQVILTSLLILIIGLFAVYLLLRL